MKLIQTLLLVLAACVFATPGVTQPPPFEAGGGDAGAGTDPGGVRYEQRKDGLVEITTTASGGVSERRLTKEEAAELRNRDEIGAISANHMVRGEAYPNPRRLAPGQSGTLKVIALLSGDAIVLAGSNVRLALDKTPGLTFGKPVVRAAKPGTRDGKFQGQPVHDDFVAFDVPMQVDAGAKSPQQIYLKGKLHLDLHSGRTGGKIGSFVADVGGRVEVGKPIPKPNVSTGYSKKGKTAPGAAPRNTKIKPSAPAGASQAGGTKSSPRTAKGETGTMQDPPAGTDPGVTEGEAANAEATEGPDYVLWGFGGGVLVLLVLLLLARRK